MNFCLKNIFSYYVCEGHSIENHSLPFFVERIHIIHINGRISLLCIQQQRNRDSWESQSYSTSVRTAVPDTPDFSKTHGIHRNLILKEDMSTTHFYSTEIWRSAQGQEEYYAEHHVTLGYLPYRHATMSRPSPQLLHCTSDAPLAS